MLRAIAIPGGTVIILAAVARAVEDAGLTPGGFWPVTFIGWLSAFGTITALIASGYALHKFSQKALFERLRALESHFDTELESLKTHYDQEIIELRDMTQREVAGIVAQTGRQIEDYRRDARETQDQVASFGTVLSGVVTQMAGSVEDRRHINQQLTQILQTQERMIQDRQNFERELMMRLNFNRA